MDKELYIPYKPTKIEDINISYEPIKNNKISAKDFTKIYESLKNEELYFKNNTI